MADAALITQMQQDMRQAMKDKDRLTVSTLRSVLARISNAEAIATQDNGYTMAVGVGSTEAARKHLSSDDVQLIIQNELHEIDATLQALNPHSDYAVELQKKASIVQKYLR